MTHLPAVYDELTPTERRVVRLQYAEDQDGKCHYCKCDLDGDPANSVLAKKVNWKLFPRNFLRYPVHLHHSHDTGLTIGAVHAYCNAVLWQYHGE